MADALSLKQLNDLTQSILIREIQNKSLQCGLVWSKISQTTYEATNDSNSFYLTRIGHKEITLDVTESGRPYVSFTSTVAPEVVDLFNTVVKIVLGYEEDKKLQEIANLFSRPNRCGKIYNHSMSGGVVGDGTAGL